ncbi:SRPBCC family protein [Corynebacterium sp. S7]
MFHIDRTTIINRPATEVFAFVADLTNSPLWEEGVVSATRVGDRPLGVGTVHKFTRNFAGRTIHSQSTFVEYEEGKHVRFVLDNRPISGWASYTVNEKSPGVTELRAILEMRFSGPMRILEPVMERQIRRSFDREFTTLKELLASNNR